MDSANNFMDYFNKYGSQNARERQTTLEDFGVETSGAETDAPSNTAPNTQGTEVEFTELLEKYNISEEDRERALQLFHGSNMSQQPLRRDNALLHLVVGKLLKLQYSKEGAYGDSWAKRGELEVFFNISRKFDRLENIVLNGAIDEVGESYVDTVGDLANYGLLWLTYIMREKPELFDAWLKEIDDN